MRLFAASIGVLLFSACGLHTYPDGGGDIWQDTATTPWSDTASPSEDTGVFDTGDPSTGDTDPPPDTGDTDTGGTTTSYPPGIGTGGSGGPTGLSTQTVSGRTYTSYVPACALTSGLPMPSVFTMHGSGGDSAGMVAQWVATADAHCFAVYGMDSEDPLSWNFATDVTGFNEVFQKAQQGWNLDLGRIFLHGYSAGANWTHVIALSNSDVFSGYAVYAGSMTYAEAYGVWPGGTGRQIPATIGHGSNDTVIPYDQATHAQAELAGAGWDVDLWTASGAGHEYRADHQGLAYAFLMANVP